MATGGSVLSAALLGSVSRSTFAQRTTSRFRVKAEEALAFEAVLDSSIPLVIHNDNSEPVSSPMSGARDMWVTQNDKMVLFMALPAEALFHLRYQLAEVPAGLRQIRVVLVKSSTNEGNDVAAVYFKRIGHTLQTHAT